MWIRMVSRVCRAIWRSGRTSPLSVAVPAGRHELVLLDMATSVIALGRIAEFKAAGRRLPPGAAVTADGEPTTDRALAALPLPVGGAKGSGMSVVFELLASGLAANPILGSDGPTLEEVDAAPFPLLVLAGERDSVLSPATVRRAGEVLGHARVEIVPGAPHSMYWETPSLFNDAVSRFLAGVTAAGVTRG
jgi:pimeloyl-ACP methyl ester carboxylesterase